MCMSYDHMSYYYCMNVLYRSSLHSQNTGTSKSWARKQELREEKKAVKERVS
jgi:hypothetical protein